MSNFSEPIIKQITSQRVIREITGKRGFIILIRNEGVDMDGKQWTWISEHVYDESGNGSNGSEYAWQQVGGRNEQA